MRTRRDGPRHLWALPLVIAALVLVYVPPSGAEHPVPSGAVVPFAAPARPAAETPPPPTDNISYVSSVDSFPLSVPRVAPLELHRVRHLPARGLPPRDRVLHRSVRGGGGGIVDMTQSLVSNASDYGFILIAINTRSPEGFYLNSPCGGPQQQDVLDAIAAERSTRHISQVFLIGFSMGSLGALTLAAHEPGMFAGVATAGTITDIFQTTAYNKRRTRPRPGSSTTSAGRIPTRRTSPWIGPGPT